MRFSKWTAISSAISGMILSCNAAAPTPSNDTVVVAGMLQLTAESIHNATLDLKSKFTDLGGKDASDDAASQELGRLLQLATNTMSNGSAVIEAISKDSKSLGNLKYKRDLLGGLVQSAGDFFGGIAKAGASIVAGFSKAGGNALKGNLLGAGADILGGFVQAGTDFSGGIVAAGESIINGAVQDVSHTISSLVDVVAVPAISTLINLVANTVQLFISSFLNLGLDVLSRFNHDSFIQEKFAGLTEQLVNFLEGLKPFSTLPGFYPLVDDVTKVIVNIPF
ncbi:uncharacterized protein G6M90_00g029910 [Metarhizium brunneum]|uniref:Cell wall mannoprotein 1 n=1 Tax=Metarhizium brunneum TaxID=500148 RepID=A0A7D5UVX2_9HYPO|nr:hypothetical protein G6M90_00g029910 [Metarhizium brunneum]